MNRTFLFENWRQLSVDRVPQYVEHAPQRFPSDGNANRPAGINNGHAAAQSRGCAHRDCPDRRFPDVLLDFERKRFGVVPFDGQRCMNSGYPAGRKFDVDDDAGDADDITVQVMIC